MATISAMNAIQANPYADVVEVSSRVTREKRTLWYRLKVLQQPERARACGAGMKANSDRRPVDPPPVVELRIKEGPSFEEGKDITFDYNANFFLYASLEAARPIAHGRVQTPAANSTAPVLTGVPASGMAYLDRPEEAGYFIFPDLSVRHEGNYRLCFSLFETTKEEKDFDLEPAVGDMPPGVDWRMEIKTNPFSVYSAKKFPGLMLSTALSQTVAEQGCRVRIRRDVRMRKRDKAGDYDRRGDDNATRHRTVTPASDTLRPRSVSNSSEHRMAYADPHRRPSNVDAYPAPPPPPALLPSDDPSNAGPRGHLSFGDPTAPHYAAPSHYALHQAPPVSPVGPYTPTTRSPRIAPDMRTYGYHSANRSTSTIGSTIGMSPGQPIKPDVLMYDRPPPSAYMPPSPSICSSHDPRSRRESYSSHPTTPMAAHSAPSVQPRTRHQPAKKFSISSLIDPQPPIEVQTALPPLASMDMVGSGSKRKIDYVVPDNSMSLHNGQRPTDPCQGRRYVYHPPGPLVYSRANGTEEMPQENIYYS